MLTALDQVANQHHLQMAKAMIPYMNPGNQKTLSLLIKFLEIQNILNFYSQNKLSSSGCTNSAESGLPDMLSDIRNYCDPEEQTLIDQWIQLSSALELYSIFSEPDSNIS